MHGKFALVYQAGIANVFKVDSFGCLRAKRGKQARWCQSSFHSCEWFCRGVIAAGGELKTYSCNRAGDVADCTWTAGLDDCPFRDEAHPPITS